MPKQIIIDLKNAINSQRKAILKDFDSKASNRLLSACKDNGGHSYGPIYCEYRRGTNVAVKKCEVCFHEIELDDNDPNVIWNEIIPF